MCLCRNITNSWPCDTSCPLSPKPAMVLFREPHRAEALVVGVPSSAASGVLTTLPVLCLSGRSSALCQFVLPGLD